MHSLRRVYRCNLSEEGLEIVELLVKKKRTYVAIGSPPSTKVHTADTTAEPYPQPKGKINELTHGTVTKAREKSRS